MAGAGFKTWVDGDILTAADVNTYLMEQAVMVFATATARTTALPTPSEGMVSYLADSNVVEVYTGAAWVSLDDPNAIQNSIVDAKGDLIAGTNSDAVARLAVGTNGQVLTADSTTATGLKWAAPAGAKILQVVSTIKNDTFSTTSSTFTDLTGLSVSITPSAATSNILVFATIQSGHNLNNARLFNLVRGSTNIAQPSAGANPSSSLIVGNADNNLSAVITFLDSPNTTSATTYKIQCRTTGGTLFINRASNDSSFTSISSITVLEVGA